MKAPSKSKVMKTSAPPFAKGGNGKMFGKQGAGPMPSGVSGKPAGGGGGKFIAGGKGKMFGKQSAGPMPSGKTAK